MEALGKPCRRRAFDSANAMHRDKGIAGKPMLRLLRFEMLHKQGNLLSAYFLGKRDEHVRAAKIPIIFQDLIFKNEVIPKRIPGEIGKHSVILVAIVPVMGEDEVGFEVCIDVLKPLLYCRPLAWEVAFAK